MLLWLSLLLQATAYITRIIVAIAVVVAVVAVASIVDICVDVVPAVIVVCVCHFYNAHQISFILLLLILLLLILLSNLGANTNQVVNTINADPRRGKNVQSSKTGLHNIAC